MVRDILYGRQPVREALRAGRRKVAALYLAEGLRRSPDLDALKRLAADQRVSVVPVSRARLESLVGAGVNHQGVAIEATAYRYAEFDVIETKLNKSRAGMVLLLDGIQDPQNLGSLLRSADAAGALGVVIPGRKAAAVTPSVVRASAGAAEHVAVARIGNLVHAIDGLKKLGVAVIGLDGCAEAADIGRIDCCARMALVIGSEGSGMRDGIKTRCDTLARIPMHGAVNSLNAAIAGALALFMLRDRQMRSPV